MHHLLSKIVSRWPHFLLHTHTHMLENHYVDYFLPLCNFSLSFFLPSL